MSDVKSSKPLPMHSAQSAARHYEEAQKLARLHVELAKDNREETGITVVGIPKDAAVDRAAFAKFIYDQIQERVAKIAALDVKAPTVESLIDEAKTAWT